MTVKTRNNQGGKWIGHAILLCLLLIATACGGGGDMSSSLTESRLPAALRANVDKAVANPGDVITFTLEAEYQPDVQIELPEISDSFSEFRIASAGQTRPTERDGRLRVGRWYKLQADAAGSYVIESIEVEYAIVDGERERLKTPKIFIEIKSLLAEGEEGEDIRDIKPPLEISHPYRTALAVLAALVALVAALLVGKKLFERWRRRAWENKIAPRPAHEEALEALEKLLAKGLVEKGLAREFCFELSEIFRRYMHARFGVPAIDLTTEEILPRIEENGIFDQALKFLVREFLTGTDLVKFAKHRPTRREADRMIEDTRKFINETSLVLTTTEQASGGDMS